jgi:DNA-binding HxlR family transcriptional regulator
MSAPADGDGEPSIARAELFEALSHPIRVRILESLESGGLRFSDLKKAAGIQSNGHLEFHLGKLAGLVSAAEGGNYALTDDGREALRFLYATQEPNHRRKEREPKTFSATSMAVVLMVVGLVIIGSVLIPTGLLLNSQSGWQDSGSTGCCNWRNPPYYSMIPPGGAQDGGLYGGSPGTTYKVIAEWATVNDSGGLVLAVLAIPRGMVFSVNPVNESLILAQTTGPNFADLTYTLPSNTRADFVLINPTQSTVMLTSFVTTQESPYNLYGQTGWNLVYVGIALLGVAVVSAGIVYLGPYLGRKTNSENRKPEGNQ